MKDTNNLLTHNQWSAGEYENTPEIFSVKPYVNNICTNNYSDIGEQSIKITKLQSSGSYARIMYNNGISNKTVTASATIKTENNSATLILLEIGSNGLINQQSVDVPANSFTKVNVSLHSTTSNTSFGVQFNNNGNVNSFIHIDNVSLYAS